MQVNALFQSVAHILILIEGVCEEMEQNEVKNLAKSLITLYDMETSTATEKEIVEKIYDEDASLSDPLFKVVGHKAIMRRFLFIKGIFERSGIEVKYDIPN